MTEEILTKKKEKADKVKVLIVDDSPMMCKVLEQIFEKDEQIQVESKVFSGREALNKISSSGSFDVCTLDVHMPGMNGLSVLKNIMVRYPIPTLMVSAFTGDGSRVTFEALRFGAVDFFKKPTRNGDEALKSQAALLCSKLKRASQVQVEAARYLRIRPAAMMARMKTSGGTGLRGIAVIYGSTGGYSSLLSIIPHLSQPLEIPLVISLGTSQENLNAFVDYLRPFSSFPLVVPEKRVSLVPGHCYFLPGSQAGTFEQVKGTWEITVKERPINAGKEGAIDLILLSAAESFGENCLAVFLSGDNIYGLTGAREVIRDGGRLLVQTPDNCLAPFLPRRMVREFNADRLGPVEIADRLSKWKV